MGLKSFFRSLCFNLGNRLRCWKGSAVRWCYAKVARFTSRKWKSWLGRIFWMDTLVSPKVLIWFISYEVQNLESLFHSVTKNFAFIWYSRDILNDIKYLKLKIMCWRSTNQYENMYSRNDQWNAWLFRSGFSKHLLDALN